MHPEISREDALKASKFLKHQFFISSEDFKKFFSNFPELTYMQTGKIFLEGQPLPTINDFLLAYKKYQDRLLSDDQPSVNDLRLDLSGAISLYEEAFGVQVVSHDKKIYKPIKPVVQFQLLSFMIGIDHKIHFAFGKDCTYLGLQILYPQLYIDETQSIKNGLKEDDSPNAKLFKAFVSFLRDETRLIAFHLNEQKLISQIRITEDLFEKIKNLPWFSQYKMQLC